MFAASEDHINDLASRYDFVGVVTHTSVLKWNTNPDRSKGGRIFPVDPEKIPGGAPYVGLVKDRGSEMPFFGDIYVKGTLYGYNEYFVRIFEVKGLQMLVRQGRGYKRR